MELHTELSQLQRLLKMGPMGGAGVVAAAAAAAATSGGCGLRNSHKCDGGLWGGVACGSPGRQSSTRPLYSRGSAEDAVAAATDGEPSTPRVVPHVGV